MSQGDTVGSQPFAAGKITEIAAEKIQRNGLYLGGGKIGLGDGDGVRAEICPINSLHAA